VAPRFALALLLTAFLLDGCGVPNNADPQSLPKTAVPYDLLAPSALPSPTSTTLSNPQTLLTPVTIYLLGATGILVARPRDVALPAALGEVLDALIGGPTAAETTDGISSSIPLDTTVLATSIADGVATIDLSSSFEQAIGEQQVEAVAQVVFTATAQVNITAVRFEVDGTPLSVPMGNGAETENALSPQDFRSLAP
jgi:spore germination protein GerM